MAFFLPMPIIPMDVQLEIRIETPPIPTDRRRSPRCIWAHGCQVQSSQRILNGEYHGKLWDMDVTRLILC